MHRFPLNVDINSTIWNSYPSNRPTRVDQCNSGIFVSWQGSTPVSILLSPSQSLYVPFLRRPSTSETSTSFPSVRFLTPVGHFDLCTFLSDRVSWLSFPCVTTIEELNWVNLVKTRMFDILTFDYVEQIRDSNTVKKYRRYLLIM